MNRIKRDKTSEIYKWVGVSSSFCFVVINDHWVAREQRAWSDADLRGNMLVQNGANYLLIY